MMASKDNVTDYGQGSQATTVDVGGKQGAFETPDVEMAGTVATSHAKKTASVGGSTYPLQDILQRDHVIPTSLNVATIDGFGNFTRFDPWDLFLSLGSVQLFTENYRGIRGDLIVTLQCNLPAGCYGLYTLSAFPEAYAPINSVNDYQIDENPSIESARHCIHGQFDCAKSNTIQLTLPFVWPEAFMDLDGRPGLTNGLMWDCVWSTIQPLRNVSSETFDAAVTVYVRLAPGYQLINPRFQSGKPSDYARAAAIGLNAGADLLDTFGFTKDAQAEPASSDTLKLFTNPSTIDGYDNSESVSLRSTPYVTTDPAYGGADSVDAASFEHLFKHWTLVATFPWSPAAAINANIGMIPVTPFLGGVTLAAAGPKLKLDLTPAGYVGLPFDYWRGGMEYQIVIPVSAFHRGALQVFWSENPVGNILYDPTPRSLNAIVDVSLGNTLELGVDYASHYPALDCVVTNQNQVLMVGSVQDSVDNHPSWANGYLAFRVVQKLLCSTNGGADGATNVLVYARAKPDMRFGCPRQVIGIIKDPDLPKSSLPLMATVKFQATIGDYKGHTAAVDLVPAKAAPDMGPMVLWGDDVQSVRGLMQRLTPVAYVGVYQYVDAIGEEAAGPILRSRTGTVTGGGPLSYLQWPCAPPLMPGTSTTVQGNRYQNPVQNITSASLNNDNAFTYAAYYGVLFSGIRTSMRVKVNRIYGPEGTAFGGQAVINPANSPATSIGFNNIQDISFAYGPRSRLYLQPQPLSSIAGAEFVVPYGENVFFKNPTVVTDIQAGADYGFCHCAVVGTMVSSGCDAATNVLRAVDQLWVGYGPDVTPIAFRRVPSVYLYLG